MRKILFYLSMVVVAGIPFLIGIHLDRVNAADSPPAKVQSPTASTWATEAPKAEADLKPAKLRKGLTLRQRREMGLTFRNVRRILAEKQKAGELEDRETSELAADVFSQLVEENPGAYQNPQLDWDAILAFIEKLIPLILKLIALFS